ncbi:MAG: fibronectin type III domain-containing protein, partial [Candidatus Woesearchaeota archaeon]
LALMSAMGLAYWAGYNAAEFVERVLSLAGWFGALAFSFLVFAIGYYNIKQQEEPKWGPILLLMGIAFMTYGTLVGTDAFYGKTMLTLGSAFIFVGIIGIILKAFGTSGTGILKGAKDAAKDAPSWWNDVKDGWNKNKPSPVSDFQAKMQPGGNVNLTWTASPESDVTHYELVRQKRARWWNVDKEFGRLTGTQATDNNLDPAAEYRYMIRAINQNNNKSKWSYASLEVKTIRVTGKAVFSAEKEYPLNGLNVKLIGNGTISGKMQNDQFTLSNVPTHHSFTLEISDPEGVYQTKRIQNLTFPESPEVHDLGSLNMHTNDKKGKIDVAVKFKPMNQPFTKPLNFIIAGTNGSEEAKDIKATNGIYKVSVPLGHVLVIKAQDVDGCFEGKSQRVLVRGHKSVPLEISPKGNFPLKFVCYDGESQLDDFNVSIKNLLTQTTPTKKAENSEAKFDIPAGYYEFKVEKEGYLPFESASNAQQIAGRTVSVPYSHNQDATIKIKLTPDAPTPSGITLSEKSKNPTATITYND